MAGTRPQTWVPIVRSGSPEFIDRFADIQAKLRREPQCGSPGGP